MSCELSEDTITFGKYKDQKLDKLLRDRKYCKWLLNQKWFSESYQYLYNRVKEYDPKKFFILLEPYKIASTTSVTEFIEKYEYFHLCPLKELKIPLSEMEKKCYKFYLKTLKSLAEKIMDNIGQNPNPFNIKAPTSWLNDFETKYKIPRDVFKEFLSAYELPNITSVVEDIKRNGGVEYKGAKSYLIAKEKSLEQELYWGKLLKQHYGQDIGTQYKYKDCIFDYIRIRTNTLYECKLGLKDFNKEQYEKYISTLGSFFLVYLIDRDCIVDLSAETIYTTNKDKYAKMIVELDHDLAKLLRKFRIQELENVEKYF